MKKLILFAVAAIALSFASCGGNKQVDAEKEAQRIQDSIKAAADEAAAKLEVAGDSIQQAADSVAADLEKK